MREKIFYLGTAQVANHFKVAQDTVRRWIIEGRLPGAINVGPKGGRPTYRVPKQAVVKLEKQLGYDLLIDVQIRNGDSDNASI